MAETGEKSTPLGKLYENLQNIFEDEFKYKGTTLQKRLQPDRLGKKNPKTTQQQT